MIIRVEVTGDSEIVDNEILVHGIFYNSRKKKRFNYNVRNNYNFKKKE
jgi:hypothetical protein